MAGRYPDWWYEKVRLALLAVGARTSCESERLGVRSERRGEHRMAYEQRTVPSGGTYQDDRGDYGRFGRGRGGARWLVPLLLALAALFIGWQIYERMTGRDVDVGPGPAGEYNP